MGRRDAERVGSGRIGAPRIAAVRMRMAEVRDAVASAHPAAGGAPSYGVHRPVPTDADAHARRWAECGEQRIPRLSWALLGHPFQGGRLKRSRGSAPQRRANSRTEERGTGSRVRQHAVTRGHRSRTHHGVGSPFWLPCPLFTRFRSAGRDAADQSRWHLERAALLGAWAPWRSLALAPSPQRGAPKPPLTELRTSRRHRSRDMPRRPGRMARVAVAERCRAGPSVPRWVSGRFPSCASRRWAVLA